MSTNGNSRKRAWLPTPTAAAAMRRIEEKLEPRDVKFVVEPLGYSGWAGFLILAALLVPFKARRSNDNQGQPQPQLPPLPVPHHHPAATTTCFCCLLFIRSNIENIIASTTTAEAEATTTTDCGCDTDCACAGGGCCGEGRRRRPRRPTDRFTTTTSSCDNHAFYLAISAASAASCLPLLTPIGT